MTDRSDVHESAFTTPPRGGEGSRPEDADDQLVGRTPADPASDPGISGKTSMAGRQLGQHALRRILGSGGMGDVYEAEHVLLKRRVAIKVLPDRLSQDQTARHRFLREAQAAAALNHPNAVALYEIGQDGEVTYIVMELVSGETADAWIRHRGAFSWQEATAIVLAVCRALAAAHRVGLVHRDVKPGNIMRSADGTVKLADFGLAKHAGLAGSEVSTPGVAVGTPAFMSPELCVAEGTIDHRCDIYSLGATYYALLSGEAPFRGGTLMQQMRAHLMDPPPDICARRQDIPRRVSEVIRKMMAKSPDERFQSADDLAVALEQILASSATSPQNVWLGQAMQTVSIPALQPVGRRRPVRGLIWGVMVAVAVLAGAVLLGPLFAPGGLLGALAGGSAGQPAGNGAGPGLPPGGVPGPTGEPIRVGILHSLTGTMSISERSVADAALLAIEELNERGGVLGRPVRFVLADGRSDPAAFAREAGRLLERERVVALFGCWTSASRRTVIPVVEQHGGLLFYPVQYEGLEQSAHVVYLGAAPNQQITPAVQWAVGNIGRRVFLVGSDYIFPRVAHAIIRDQLASLGAELAGVSYLPLGSLRADGLVQQIVESRADVVINTINGDSNVAFFRELRLAGLTPRKLPVISLSIAEPELTSLDARDVAGHFAAWTYFQSLPGEANAGFVQRFRARYGQDRVISDPMEAAYVGVKLWALAVEKAGSTDPASVRAALADVRLTGPGGWGRLDSENQHAFKRFYLGKIRHDGQFDVVYQSNAEIAPMPWPPSRPRVEWEDYVLGWFNRWGQQWNAPAP
mgnify:CR=1 FL=1